MRRPRIEPGSWQCLICSLFIAGCFSEPGKAVSGGSSGSTGPAASSSSGTTGEATTTGGAETTAETTSSGVVADSTGDSSSGIVTGSSSTGAFVDPSLVMWLRFEDDPLLTGGAVDSSNNGFDAVCVTVCPSQTEGPPGRGSAVLFSEGELLTIGDEPEFQLTEALSFAAWVRLDVPPAAEFGLVFGRNVSAAPVNVYDIYYQQSEGGYVASVAGQVSPVAQAGVEEWVHIAGTWSEESGLLRIYLDGVAQGTATSVATLPAYPAGDMLIGSDVSNGTPVLPFEGAMDDLRLYDRELSPAEVLELAQP